jgi:large subunit ribosomal protein L32e
MAEVKKEVEKKEAKPVEAEKPKPAVTAKPAAPAKPKAEAKPQPAKDEAAAKPKAEVKKEAKPKAEVKKKEEPVKEAKPKAKAKPKPAPKAKIMVSDEVKALKKQVQKKGKLPTFRGRFGTRSLRRASKAKWNKWRKPRGIDIYRHAEDGAWPQTGYKTDKKIRGLHPSGFEEVRVFNVNDLAKLDPKMQAARIASTVGRKKRMEIRAKAQELNLKLLNR